MANNCALSTRAFKFAFVKKSYNFSCLQLSAEVSVNFGLSLCCQVQIYNNFYSNSLGIAQFTFFRQKVKKFLGEKDMKRGENGFFYIFSEFNK